MKAKISVAMNFILIILLSVSVFFLWQINEKYQRLSLTLLNPEEGQHRTFVQGQWLEGKNFIVEDERVFLSLSAFEAAIDSEVTLSGTGQRIYVKVANIRHDFEDEMLTQYIEANLNDINIPLLYRESVAYLDMELIERLYPVSHHYFAESDNLIVFSNEGIRRGRISPQTDKYQMVNAEYFKTDTSANEENLWILTSEASERDTSYYEAVDETGKIVYIKRGKVSDLGAVTVEQSEFKSVESKVAQPFSLTFEVIDRYEDNFKKSKTAFDEGIHVVSPTWFNLNIEGIVINSADYNYVRTAKHQGVTVWGLFKNNFDPKWTESLVNSEAFTKKAVAQMLLYSAIYDLDGINIDFENVYLKDQRALTAFVTELSSAGSRHGLTLSMDVTRPKGSDTWSKVYDRSALAKQVDYMVLMAYDEHWGSSPISGSVASMGWTEDSITMSLEEIPRDKLVLGIPLYMRVWHETPVSGNKYKKVGSQAITLAAYDKLRDEKNLSPVYDSDSGQYYTEYFEGKDKYRIWIEDESALLKRLNMMDDYNLPGVATWRRGFERNDTFTVIFEALKLKK